MIAVGHEHSLPPSVRNISCLQMFANLTTAYDVAEEERLGLLLQKPLRYVQGLRKRNRHNKFE